MSKRPSMTYQVNQALQCQARFGESKHYAKEGARLSGGGGWGTAPPGIFSVKTMENYRDQCLRFAHWTKQEYGAKTLDEAKQYVDQYLQRGIDRSLSASTIKLQAAAIRKMYQEPALGRSIALPERARDDFTRSRGEKVSDRHFSESRNQAMVDFAKGTGLRREGMEKVRGEDVVKDQQDRVWVHTVEKGGRERWAPVTQKYNDHVWAMANRVDPGQRIFEHVHAGADIHSYRHEYAQERHREENNGKDYELYHPNHQALMEVSENLGHSREDVVVHNYLR